MKHTTKNQLNRKLIIFFYVDKYAPNRWNYEIRQLTKVISCPMYTYFGMPKIVVGETRNFSYKGKTLVWWSFWINLKKFWVQKHDKILIDSLFHLLITWEQNKKINSVKLGRHLEIIYNIIKFEVQLSVRFLKFEKKMFLTLLWRKH